jgi:hypothetical protein
MQVIATVIKPSLYLFALKISRRHHRARQGHDEHKSEVQQCHERTR